MVIGHTHAPLSHVTCVTTASGCQAPSPDLPVTHFFSGDHQRPGLHSPSLHSGKQGLAASRPCDSALCPAALQSCRRREFDTKSANISLHEAQFISCSRTSKRAKLGGLPNRLCSLCLMWSVSVIGCCPPIEPHVQSSGCEMKETVVGGGGGGEGWEAGGERRCQQFLRQWALG